MKLETCVAITPESCVAITLITRKKCAGMTAIRQITRKFLIRNFDFYYRHPLYKKENNSLKSQICSQKNLRF